MKTQPQKLNVTSLLDNCLDMFDDLMQDKKIIVVREMAKNHLEVNGDEQSFQKVFGYLILNAIEAMEGNTKKLLTVRTATDQSWVAVDIENTGCGVFEASSKELPDSSGISKKSNSEQGLQIVKSVVTRRGGKLLINGGEGKGNGIRVRLPVKAVATKIPPTI